MTHREDVYLLDKAGVRKAKVSKERLKDTLRVTLNPMYETG